MKKLNHYGMICRMVLYLGLLVAVGDADELTIEKIGRGIVDGLLQMVTPSQGDVAETRAAFDRAFAQQKLNQSNSTYDPDADSYYKFLPTYVTTLKPNSVEFKLTDARCFKNASVSSVLNNITNEVIVEFNLKEHHGLGCRMAYLIATDSQFHVEEYFTSGTKTLTFKSPKTPAEHWDLIERGPRVFMFWTTLETTMANIVKTALLFMPVLTTSVFSVAAKANLKFLKNHVGIEMARRSVEEVEVDKSLVKNGDTFNMIRLDGLDPMIAMAMGAATGHTVIALWKDEELYLCEANAQSSYWPINGVQCHTYQDWMKIAKKADHNVVWAPLDRNLTLAFDADKAWKFIDDHLGVDYGYEVLLTGWLDTNEGNKVCLNREGTWCLEPAYHLELIFSIVDRISQDAVRIFKPAMMNRAGITNYSLPLVEVYHKASQELGIRPEDLHNQPELDTYVYQTTKNKIPVTSDVSICNVFVCKVLREAGILGKESDFHCGEVSVNDMYRLNIYEREDLRPDQCKEADPENPLCQVLGKYKLRLDSQPGVLPRFNYVEVEDFDGSNCPSRAPDYLAPKDC